MKKALSIILAAVMLCGAVFAAGCLPNPKGSGRDTGNIDVDYGKTVADGGTIDYIAYSDGTPITFMYQNYFVQSSDEGDSFVAKGPDDNSVLMYTAGELSESRPFEAIAAYSDEEAQKWISEIQLGLVSSQGVSGSEIKDYRFAKFDDHLYLYYDADVTYSTGLIQRNTLVNYILPDGALYTIQAFAPASAIEKYGALFKEVKYNGTEPDEPIPADSADYSLFDNGSVSFLYRNAFNVTDAQDVLFSMVPESYAMLAGSAGTLEEGHTYAELAAMPNGELLTYLSSLSGITADEADYVSAAEENGVLRLEAHYTNSTVLDETLYCVVVRFVKQDGGIFTLFAYMNEAEPIKDISFAA